MSDTPNDQHEEHQPTLPDRRKFLAVGAGVAAATLLSCNARSNAAPAGQAATTTAAGNAHQDVRPGRRKLGQLEVSSVASAFRT
jgi:nitrous oxide reductase